MSKKYPEILNAVFESHDELMPFAVPAESTAIILLYQGQAYRVSMNEDDPLNPLIFRYTGFGMGEPLMVGEDKAIDALFRKQMKAGLHAYLQRILSIGNGELLPEPLQKYVFRNITLFQSST